MNGVFVTGTGTEVGKTVVAAVIARTLTAEGKKVTVFKPAVTGLDDFPTSAADGPKCQPSVDISAHRPMVPDHHLLRTAAGSGQDDEEIAPYRYGPAASPHLAAALAGEEIDPERLRAVARAAAANAEVLVCEGVGGLLVPLRADYFVRDLAVDLGLPLVIAASPGLGTINHTLLTIEAARAADLHVETVILTPWPEAPTSVEESNRDTIEAVAGVRVETLPPLDLEAPDSWPALPAPRHPG